MFGLLHGLKLDYYLDELYKLRVVVSIACTLDIRVIAAVAVIYTLVST